jgi:uncharacterized membrane protein YbaN (DUF454 family)
VKLLFITLGLVSLGLGIVGIFLPLLPTTPFLLLSAYLFARSSQRWYHWLLNHHVFGAFIRSYREDKAIPLKMKIIALTLLWITMSFSIFWVLNGKLWLQLLLASIAVGVSIFLMSLKTKKV